MRKSRLILFAGILSLIFVSAVWQFAETDIYAFGEKALATVTGKPFYHVERFDDKGIPMQLYNSGEVHYNPLFIAREAQIEGALRILEGKEKRFFLLTDWLLANLSETDSTCYIEYQFDFPIYDRKKPWVSALAQASLMNALAQRAAADRDVKILAKARKVLYSLSPGVAGLTYELPDSSLWFMEYPAEKPYYVLNGMMGVLLELHKYHQLTNDPLAKDLYQRGLKALQTKLPEFDYHGYSYYDLTGKKAGRGYHRKHITQLNDMHRLEPDNIFGITRDRWQKADSYPIIYQMMLNPRPKRVLSFTLAWLLLWFLVAIFLAYSHKNRRNDPEHS